MEVYGNFSKSAVGAWEIDPNSGAISMVDLRERADCITRTECISQFCLPVVVSPCHKRVIYCLIGNLRKSRELFRGQWPP